MYPFHKTVALSLLFSLPFSAAALKRAELLPPNGQTYFRVSNTSACLEEIKKSSVGQLWFDEQFQNFMGNPEIETWHSVLFEGDSNEENDVFVEQMKMLTGEVVFGMDLGTDDIYIVANISADDFKRSLELDENLRNVIDDPFEVMKHSFQGVEIVEHINQPGTEIEYSSWQAYIDETLLLGYNREWIEQCIVRIKNEGITEPEGLPALNINLPVKDMLRQSLEADSPEVAAENRALYEALGLLGIDLLTCRFELHDDEMIIHNNLQVSELDRGLFKLLDTEPAELPTATFIPENISSLIVGRIDLLSLWHEIPSMLQQIEPGAKPQFDSMVAIAQQQTGINIEQDLLAHLGTKYLSFATANSEQQTSVFALSLEDGLSFRQGLESALSAPAMQAYVSAALEMTDFLDHTIYTLKNAAPEDAEGIVVTDEYLLYGTPESLRQTLRAMSSAAAANNAFEQTDLVKGIRQHVSPRAFGFGAVDWKKNMDAIISEISDSAYTALIEQNWAKSGSVLPPPDFSKIPPASHVAQFFNTTYQYIEATESGLYQKLILKY